MPEAHYYLSQAQAARQPYLELLSKLVSFETPTHDKAACDALANWLEPHLQHAGWHTERIHQRTVGDQLIARVQGTQPGERTLLLTHYDTVWPVGTLATMPLRQEQHDDALHYYGPGILDMKAGIAAAMTAVALLRDSKTLRGEVTLLLSSDEETGSQYSRDQIEQLARAHDRVLVLEPAREDGAFKLGRKGTAFCHATFRGVSAHAGNNPQDGASALRELAHFLLFVEALHDASKGTSVNLTVAQGGSTNNVIAEHARAEVDIRVLQVAEYERLESAIRSYHPKDDRVTLTLTLQLNRPPLEPTANNRALFQQVEAFYQDMGKGCEAVTVGGGSDGNFTAALGVPTLDGLGAVGAGLHARHEHIRLEPSLERLALLSYLLAEPLS